MPVTSNTKSKMKFTFAKRIWQERIVTALITTIAFSGIAAVVLIIVFVAKEAVPLFLNPEHLKEASLSKMFLPQVVRVGKPAAFVWQPVGNIPKVSLIPLFIGTLKTALLGMLFAVPLAISSAVYVSEFAHRRVKEWLKPAIELLAGIPSVVLGFFAMMVIATWLQDTFHLAYRLNSTVAGIGLALAIIPVIFTVAEDALTAVPKSYREASLALGATAWETAWKVVVPAAAPGVLAACLLGLGRAVGETMIVLMASGNAAIVSLSPTDSSRSMSATIAAEMGEVVTGSPHFAILFFIGVQLFVVALILNSIAGAYVRYLANRYKRGSA